MKLSGAVPVSLALCWILSPDVLVRLGKGVGTGQTLFLATLAFSAVLAGLAVQIIRHPALRGANDYDSSRLLTLGLGKLPAMVIILASRISLVLLLPTGLLVAAGYTFNEVFLYWFPNFGFSFLLLALIVALHLLGERPAKAMQPFFAGLTLLPLAVLCLLGMAGLAGSPPVSVDTGLNFQLSTSLGGLLLFLGYDYAEANRGDSRLPASIALLISLVLFIIWGLLSLQYAPAGKLAAADLPHMLIARQIAGTPGRWIMGVAVIAGVAGAVSGLFYLACRSLADLADRDLLPGHGPHPFHRRLYIVLFAALIGILMMTGLAGHDSLEIYLEGSLLLWLIHSGCQCLAAGILLRRLQHAMASPAIGLGLILLLATILIIVSHEQAYPIAGFCLLVLLATTLISALWLKLNRTIEARPDRT